MSGVGEIGDPIGDAINLKQLEEADVLKNLQASPASAGKLAPAPTESLRVASSEKHTDTRLALPTTFELKELEELKTALSEGQKTASAWWLCRSPARMYSMVCMREKLVVTGKGQIESRFALYAEKYDILEASIDDYMRDLVDVWSLLIELDDDHSVSTQKSVRCMDTSELYSTMVAQRFKADEFYWQVFPIIATAEAFIFYITVGSGAEENFPDARGKHYGRKLMVSVGLGFVFICWYSFYVNKSKLDIYTRRLFWMEVLTNRPRLHSRKHQQVNERRFFSTSLYNAWQNFFVFLIACHVISLVWMFDATFVPWTWLVLGGALLYALTPDLFRPLRNFRRRVVTIRLE